MDETEAWLRDGEVQIRPVKVLHESIRNNYEILRGFNG
jgi:hypothetical protein